jgi:hypothetical protein
LLLQGTAFVGLAIAVAGIAFFVFVGSKDKLIIYDSLLAACSLWTDESDRIREGGETDASSSQQT